jgi:diadenosine tetraphosphate (Ap4A) HIT family hydrolase
MPTVFTRIIDGELPGRFVWRDDRAVAFMSIAPLKPGHTLVVPVEEVEHWIDASPDLLAHLMTVSHRIGGVIDRIWRPEKVGLVVAGLEVPHLHLHLVPMWTPFDLDFANADTEASPESLDEAAARIREGLRQAGDQPSG